MVRRIAKPWLRALILLLACLGAQASLPTLQGPAAQTAPAQTAPAQTAPCETILFAKEIDQELSGGEKRCFSFTLGAGQFVLAAVEQRGIDVAVTILGPGGEPVTSVDRLNGTYGPENASLIAQSSGVYRLQIQSIRSESNPGRYRITLNEPRAAISSDEKRMAAEKLIVEAGNLKAQNTTDALRLAAEKYKTAGSLWNEVGAKYEEGLALYVSGLCYRALGANQMAISVYERALELMRDAKDGVGIAIVHGGMGWSYYYLGALDQALEYFEQSLQARQRMMNGAGAAQMHYGIGMARIGRKENQLALESFKESLRLRYVEKDPRVALTRIGLGKAYFRLERYDESRATLEEALRTMRKSKDVGGQIDALHNLGGVDLRL